MLRYAPRFCQRDSRQVIPGKQSSFLRLCELFTARFNRRVASTIFPTPYSRCEGQFTVILREQSQCAPLDGFSPAFTISLC